MFLRQPHLIIPFLPGGKKSEISVSRQNNRDVSVHTNNRKMKIEMNENSMGRVIPKTWRT